jgi:alcohol dehydrogenase (cytochrome c)
MNLMRTLIVASLFSGIAFSQGALTLAKLGQPTPDSWPTYNGDYSGRRYSPLTKINSANIRSLSLAWAFRAVPGGNLNATVKATPLVVNGVMYFTIPDHVWAIDAQTGRQIWHYTWKSQGGDHIGNRGVGIIGDSLFFETPDCHLVSLDLKEGTERWNQRICDLNQYYF